MRHANNIDKLIMSILVKQIKNLSIDVQIKKIYTNF